MTLGVFCGIKSVSRFASAFAIVFTYLAIDAFVKLALVNFALAGVPAG
ncbi:MAG: hypothetical protein LAT81_06105 [Oceanicaulis sp.]|nr:hypothetical protein [Oceanicaulis sp.]